MWAPIGDLRPWADNPRDNDGAPVEAVVRSIQRFGFASPIVARTNGEIIAGHTRYKAALQLGLGRVPVRYVDLDPAEAHLLAVADNKTNELASWDAPKLHELLRDLPVADLGDLGFNEKDLSKLTAELLRNQLGEGVEQDEVPEPPKTAVTKLGDVWKLGDHRLTCGDCTAPETIDRVLQGDKIQAMVVTDPPYGVAYAGCLHKQIETGKPAREAIENDALDPEQLHTLLSAVFTAAFERSVAGAPYYVFGPSGAELSRVFLNALNDSGWLLKHGLAWVKDQMVFGRADFHYQHESVWYGWKPGAAHYFGGTKKDVSTLHFDRPKQSKEHPTMKPIPLVAYLVERAASPGSIVLDPFGGSGTTLLACQQLGRVARTSELEPRYCDVIVERWQNFTGLKASRA